MMSAFLLHENAEVLCPHTEPDRGQASPTLINQRVKVSGQKIVTQPGPYTIIGCKLPPAPPPPGPCVTALWTSAATRVRAGGMPVLYKDSQATCAPTGAVLEIRKTQTRVKVT